MKINDVLIEAQNDEIVLQQGENTIRFHLPVMDTDQILNSMQNPSYEELEAEKQAHRERVGKYRDALQLAEDLHTDAHRHFEEQQQLFFRGETNVQGLEEARETYESTAKRLQQMKDTFAGWSSLSNVTAHDENSVYGSYRAALDELNNGNLQELKQVREALENMLKFVDEKIHQQKNHVWDYHQKLERQTFMPRGYRMSLHGNSFAKPTRKKQVN